MNPVFVLIITAAVAWVILSLVVPPIAAVCRQRGWLDQPGPRKIHATPTPRLTGVSFFIAVWAAILLIGILYPDSLMGLRPQFVPVLTGSFLILALGIIDDLYSLPGLWKLTGQVVAGMPLWLSGIGFGQLWIPFVGGTDLGMWALPVSVLWFLILVNAVNIIDGVDGLATATSGVATLTLIWITYTLHILPLAVVAAALFGALVGFWRYNRPPAKVFMGDSGSLTLGYFIAVIALLAPIKRFTALAFFVPLIAMLLPLGESAWSVVRRSAAGVNPMRGDAEHVHHVLLSSGWSPRQVVVAYAVVSVIFGVFCVAFHYFNRKVLAVILGFFVLLLGIGLAIISARKNAGVDD
jgi:UDP-GlcNAc:undecaprenyl-phosphate GlcNAc-1-phosphate transferase